MARDDTYSHRPLLDKLGVRPGHRVSVIGTFKRAFIDDLRDRGANVSVKLRPESDLIFYWTGSPGDFDRLPELRAAIKPNGAIWLVRLKGKDATLKDTDLIDAGLSARMVDNKIASFSDTESAMRLVIRLVDRP